MLKLLVVEDHALVREGLVRLLGQIEEGATVFEAADFESALTVLDNEEEFDLVLLDLALPGIDGFAGLDILRRRYPAMPVLCLMVRGLSNRDIADQLDLSEGTVKIHATAVFKALGVTSRTQALVAVARYGIDFENVF